MSNIRVDELSAEICKAEKEIAAILQKLANLAPMRAINADIKVLAHSVCGEKRPDMPLVIVGVDIRVVL